MKTSMQRAEYKEMSPACGVVVVDIARVPEVDAMYQLFVYNFVQIFPLKIVPLVCSYYAKLVHLLTLMMLQ